MKRALFAASLLLSSCDGPREAMKDRMPEPIVIPALDRVDCSAPAVQLREEIARLRQRNLRLEILVETLRRGRNSTLPGERIAAN